MYAAHLPKAQSRVLKKRLHVQQLLMYPWQHSFTRTQTQNFKKKKNLDEHEALQCKYSLTLVLPHYGALREHIRGFYNNKE